MQNNNGLAKFICGNCGKTVDSSSLTGTKQRNHCPSCLFSKHVDENSAGDRLSKCRGLMEPIALTFKEAGSDKYGKKKQGELMLVHACQKCGKISLNRIAADDDPEKILKILSNAPKSFESSDFLILSKADEPEIKRQLFGNKPNI